MNKKTFIAAIITLVVAVCGMQTLLVNASTVSVQEPQNKVYAQTTVPLVFSYTTPTYPYSTVSLGGFSYILDHGSEATINPSVNSSMYTTTIPIN